MAISEAKMKIVIDNYFKVECDVNTSIREAFEKGFRIGVMKGAAVPEVDAVPVVHGRWIVHGEAPIFIIECSVCNQHYFNHEKQEKAKYCGMCGARMNLEEQNEG